MQEVFQVIKQGILLMGLYHLARIDWKTQLVNEKDLWILAISGIILNVLLFFLQGKQNLLESNLVEELIKIVCAMLIGGVLLLIAVFTKEQIGVGDAYLFCVTGIFLDYMQNLTLLLGTLFLTGLFCIGSFLLKKKGKNDTVAMIPFTLTAYVLFVL